MTARTMLAALSWNCRGGRVVAKTASGEDAMDVVYNKRKKTWFLRARYLKTKNKELEVNLVSRMMQVCSHNISLPRIPSPDKGQTKPSVSELSESFMSRFK